VEGEKNTEGPTELKRTERKSSLLDRPKRVWGGEPDWGGVRGKTKRPKRRERRKRGGEKKVKISDS